MLEDGRRAIIARHAAAPWRLFIGDLLSFAVFGLVAGVAMGISVLVLAGLTGLNPADAARVEGLSQIHGGVGLIAILVAAVLVARRHGVGPGQAMLGVRGLDEEGRRVDARYLFVRLITNMMLGGALSVCAPILLAIFKPGATGAAVLITLGLLPAFWVLAFRVDRSGRTPGHAAASMVPLSPGHAEAYRAELSAAGYLDVSPYWLSGRKSDAENEAAEA